LVSAPPDAGARHTSHASVSSTDSPSLDQPIGGIGGLTLLRSSSTSTNETGAACVRLTARPDGMS
jgi:hypothetical protein